MIVRRHSPATFLDHAGPFLEGAEAENSLVLGIGAALAEGAMTLSAVPILATVDDGVDVLLAALRTPPHNLLLSTGGVDAVHRLADALKEEGTGLPGVTGPADLAEAFAVRWAGPNRELVMRQRVHRCAVVRPPPAPGGALRLAEASDRQRAVALLLAFNAEASNPGSEASVERLVRDLVAEARLFVWEDEGTIVSIAAARQPTPHGIRVGYVYTPPERRRRGYAAAITAGVTQRMLDEGFAMCVLYTDAANPTSNAIYQRVGYVPCGESAVWSFPA